MFSTIMALRTCFNRSLASSALFSVYKLLTTNWEPTQLADIRRGEGGNTFGVWKGFSGKNEMYISMCNCGWMSNMPYKT